MRRTGTAGMHVTSCCFIMQSVGYARVVMVLLLPAVWACEGQVAGSTLDAQADAAVPIDGGPRPDVATPNDSAPAVDTGPPPVACGPLGEEYARLSREGPKTDRRPDVHPDLNVRLRGWESTGGTLGLVDIDGPTDTLAPKLDALFEPRRVPTFVGNYRVRDWDWGADAVGGLIDSPEVTLVSVQTGAGEVVHVPEAGYDIGGGLAALVLYVSDDAITLKYTREDHVVYGYTIHVLGVCVDPELRSLYDALDAAGRNDLPALRPHQPFGQARGTDILVAVRDTGQFMDPRSRKDWW